MAAPSQLYISQSLELLTPPKTPPEDHVIHSWPEPETEREEIDFEIPWNVRPEYADGFNVPHQEVLLLHGPKQKYAHTREQPIPSLKNDREMLVEVEVVGLNPIDWKAPYVESGIFWKAWLISIQRFRMGFTRSALHQWARSCWEGSEESRS
jgi:hypothetical protein